MDEVINARPFIDEEKAMRQRAEAKAAELQALMESNAAAERELASMRKGLDLGRIAILRANMLADFMLGDLDGNPPAYAASEFPRLDFELGVQRVFAQQLAALLPQVVRQQLTDGIQVNGLPAGGQSKLIIPGR